MREFKAKLIAAGHEVVEWSPKNHVHMVELVTKFFLSDGGHYVMKEVQKTGEPLHPTMKMYGEAKELNVSQIWALQAERTTLAKEFLDRWVETGKNAASGNLDAIVMPATPFAGNPHDKFHDYIGYTSVFNLVDYAVGTLPVTRANAEVDAKERREMFYSSTDKRIYDEYDPLESHRGVVGLQVAGRCFQEEKVVEMLHIFSRI